MNVRARSGSIQRLGDRLVEAGLINERQLNDALEQQRRSGRPLGHVVVELGYVREEQLTAVLAGHLGASVVDLREVGPDPAAVTLLPEDFQRRNIVIPVRVREDRLLVVMARPDDAAMVEEISKITGHPVDAALGTRSDILQAISRMHGIHARLQAAATTYSESRVQPLAVRADAIDLATLRADSPAVEIANLLIVQALRDRASDIHIEPQESYLRVRFRVDGVLMDVAHLEPQVAPALASRLKVMAEMDIVERRRPQDGQLSVLVSGSPVDIRVASMGTIWGEKIVMRVLDKSRSLITLEALGFSPEAYKPYRDLVDSPYGMILVCGPTGSGKTTTLYASINALDNADRNLVTIEDPVEYTFPNINQTQINRAIDVTFANGLRSILRQDPDTILVGEIRDRETAEIAINSALTGHLVLSSLHATDAIGALLRFIDMGVEPYLVTSAVIGVVSQRLVRKVCDHCRTPHPPSAVETAFAESLGERPPESLYSGAGCDACSLTGYYDRIGVYEVVVLSDELKRLVARGATHAEMTECARQGGMIPMRLDAYHKAVAGKTTVQEILRSVYVL